MDRKQALPWSHDIELGEPVQIGPLKTWDKDGRRMAALGRPKSYALVS